MTSADDAVYWIVMKKKIWIIIAVMVVVAAGIYLYVEFAGVGGRTGIGMAPGTAVKIVAAENFYGNIAQQIGGDKVLRDEHPFGPERGPARI